MRSNRHHVTQPEPRIALGSTRRRLLGAPLAAAAAGVFAPAAFAVPSTNPRAQDVRLAPLYYPLKNVRPEVPLDGMLAVVTGASRGIGLGLVREFRSRGWQVIASVGWRCGHFPLTGALSPRPCAPPPTTRTCASSC